MGSQVVPSRTRGVPVALTSLREILRKPELGHPSGNPYTTPGDGSGRAPGRGRPGPSPLEPGGRDLRRRGPAPWGFPHPGDVRGRQVPPRPHPREAEEADVDPRGRPLDRQGVGVPRRPGRHPAPVHEDGVHVPEPEGPAPEERRHLLSRAALSRDNRAATVIPPPGLGAPDPSCSSPRTGGGRSRPPPPRRPRRTRRRAPGPPSCSP